MLGRCMARDCRQEHQNDYEIYESKNETRTNRKQRVRVRCCRAVYNPVRGYNNLTREEEWIRNK